MELREDKIMSGRYQFGWIIQILSKDEEGFQIELADLGNGKHMIVATDLTHLVSKDTYRQAGFGPFIMEEGFTLDIHIAHLKDDLKMRRIDNE
jgi:hypothetical protein